LGNSADEILELAYGKSTNNLIEIDGTPTLFTEQELADIKTRYEAQLKAQKKKLEVLNKLRRPNDKYDYTQDLEMPSFVK